MKKQLICLSFLGSLVLNSQIISFPENDIFIAPSELERLWPLEKEDIEDLKITERYFKETLPEVKKLFIKNYNNLLRIKPYEKFGSPLGKTKRNLLTSLIAFIIKLAYKAGVDVYKSEIMEKDKSAEEVKLLGVIKDIERKYSKEQKDLLNQAKTMIFKNYYESEKTDFKNALEALNKDYQKVRNAIGKLQSKASREFIKTYPDSLYKIFSEVVKEK